MPRPYHRLDRGERHRRQRKPCRSEFLRCYVLAGLERRWSPEQIAGRLRHEAGDGGTDVRRRCLLPRSARTWQKDAVESTEDRPPRATPTRLTNEHELTGFACGEPSLDEWLERRALANQVSSASRTYVVCEDRRVAGSYCLASGAIAVA